MTTVSERDMGSANNHNGESKMMTEYTIKNDQIVAKVVNFGGILNVLEVKNKNNEWTDIVTGWDSVDGIVENRRFSGRLVGRYANRIANGTFELDGVKYNLEKNNGGPDSNMHHLHGGKYGFDQKFWNVKIISNGIELTYESEDMEEGYPGTLTATVKYLVNQNKLEIIYQARSTKKTIVNLTNHVYFNLDGHDHWTDLRHQSVAIFADKYTPVDETAIPYGRIDDVSGTKFDIKNGVYLTKNNLAAVDDLVGGYDHNFCIKTQNSKQMKDVAVAKSDLSGIRMMVRGTQPGVQFYTSQFLDGKNGKYNTNYPPQSAFCLETQHFPDSPNNPNFPSATLEPEIEYEQIASFEFTAE